MARSLAILSPVIEQEIGNVPGEADDVATEMPSGGVEGASWLPLAPYRGRRKRCSKQSSQS